MPSTLNILLVGNGGREHALAWKLSQSPLVSQLFITPGNGGTSTLPKATNIKIPQSSPTDFSPLITFAKENNIHLLIPGPEQPLVDGITDAFAKEAPEVRVFGPSKMAAVMEGSKTFSKDFMARHSIPTASYGNFSNYDEARTYLEKVWADHKVVLKADGLAAGKGVILPQTLEEAQKALEEIMVSKAFGEAGSSVVIEELLEGHEISILSSVMGR